MNSAEIATKAAAFAQRAKESSMRLSTRIGERVSRLYRDHYDPSAVTQEYALELDRVVDTLRQNGQTDAAEVWQNRSPMVQKLGKVMGIAATVSDVAATLSFASRAYAKNHETTFDYRLNAREDAIRIYNTTVHLPRTPFSRINSSVRDFEFWLNKAVDIGFSYLYYPSLARTIHKDPEFRGKWMAMEAYKRTEAAFNADPKEPIGLYFGNVYRRADAAAATLMAVAWGTKAPFHAGAKELAHTLGAMAIAQKL